MGHNQQAPIPDTHPLLNKIEATDSGRFSCKKENLPENLPKHPLNFCIQYVNSELATLSAISVSRRPTEYLGSSLKEQISCADAQSVIEHFNSAYPGVLARNDTLKKMTNPCGEINIPAFTLPPVDHEDEDRLPIMPEGHTVAASFSDDILCSDDPSKPLTSVRKLYFKVYTEGHAHELISFIDKNPDCRIFKDFGDLYDYVKSFLRIYESTDDYEITNTPLGESKFSHAIHRKVVGTNPNTPFVFVDNAVIFRYKKYQPKLSDIKAAWAKAKELNKQHVLSPHQIYNVRGVASKGLGFINDTRASSDLYLVESVKTKSDKSSNLGGYSRKTPTRMTSRYANEIYRLAVRMAVVAMGASPAQFGTYGRSCKLIWGASRSVDWETVQFKAIAAWMTESVKKLAKSKKSQNYITSVCESYYYVNDFSNQSHREHYNLRFMYRLCCFDKNFGDAFSLFVLSEIKRRKLKLKELQKWPLHPNWTTHKHLLRSPQTLRPLASQTRSLSKTPSKQPTSPQQLQPK